jgi:ornithine carbamoyltransferase
MPNCSFANLTKISDLTSDSLQDLLELAAHIKAAPRKYDNKLSGRSFASMYEKPSTRTRVSAAVAAHRLGMSSIELPVTGLQMTRGESLTDTARVLSEYVDLLLFRTYEHNRIEELASAATIPVINGLTNEHHPCQALADMLTLREIFGQLDRLKTAFIGDVRGNIGRSFLEAATLSGMHVTVASPEDCLPDEKYLGEINSLCDISGTQIKWCVEPQRAAVNADVIYPEVWVPMDQEEDREKRIRLLSSYQVNIGLMEICAPRAVFMHCLPAFRGQEVTAEVIDGPRSVVWQQAANRVPVCEAAMLQLCRGAEMAADRG